MDVTHSGGAKGFELVQMKVEPRQKRLLNKETYLKGAFLSVKGLSDFYKEQGRHTAFFDVWRMQQLFGKNLKISFW